MEVQVFPSLLSADFSHLAKEIQLLEEAGADGLHLDIMDGHFVKNFSMGEKIVAAVNSATDLFLDVHLMIYSPFDYIERFIKAGADMISIHFEATEDIEDTLKYIQRAGKKAGLVFNPETSLSMIPKYLDQCDLILFMSVHPGFGGQKFISPVLEKIAFTKDLCKKLNIDIDIQVDGGINEETAKDCIAAGANILVSGNYLFSQKDKKKAIQKLKRES